MERRDWASGVRRARPRLILPFVPLYQSSGWSPFTILSLLPVFWPFAWVYVAYRMVKTPALVPDVVDAAIIESVPMLRRRPIANDELEL